MSPLDPNDLLDLIERIYDVALSADRWEPMLERMAGLFGGSAATFFVHDCVGFETIFARIWGLSAAMLAESIPFGTTQELGLDMPFRLPAGRATTEQLIPPDVYRRSEALSAFLARWDVERFVGGDVFRDARRVGAIAVLASRRRPAFDHSEVDAMELLIPHLRRAIELRSHLDERDANRSVAQDLIDGMLTGVVLLDADGRIVTVNAKAREIVAARDGLGLVADRFRAADPGEDELLRKAIAEAIRISQRTDAAGDAALTIRRVSGGRPYAVLVSPGATAAAHAAFRIASAVVLIGDPDSALGAAEAVTMQLYGLTPSEARLACAVASGESLETYAHSRSISVATARWTLKQVLSKTGAKRQADLVRILLTGPAALAPRSRT